MPSIPSICSSVPSPLRAAPVMLLAGAALCLLGCPGNPPPGPLPSPSPTVAPTPTPTPTPPPVDMSLLLRREGSVITYWQGKPFPWVIGWSCCWDGDPDGDGVGWAHSMGWPWFDNAFVDFAKANGLTGVGGRYLQGLAEAEPVWPTGPYIEVNGKADLEHFDPAHWAVIRQTSEYAQSQGLVQVHSLLDRWAEKWAHRGYPHAWLPENNVQGIDALSGFGTGSLNETVKAYVRHAVENVCHVPGIVWEDGNEMFTVSGFNPEWTNELRALVLQVENEQGCPVHMFATNSGRWAMATSGDMFFEHTNGLAVADKGRPTVVTEYNPNPSLTGAEWFAQYCSAKAQGSYYDLWRSGMDDAEYSEALRLLREGQCENVPPPPTCRLNTPQAAAVPNATVRIGTSGQGLDATPYGSFGEDYYCQPAMNWPEACAEGRKYGPVAPEGHPDRLACEQVFLGSTCPHWKAECTGTPEQCPITFDITRQGQDQSSNAAAGCPSYTEQGNFKETTEAFWVRPGGKGIIYACDVTGRVCGSREIDQ